MWSLSENDVRTDFEIGLNLEDAISMQPYHVSESCNEFKVHRWDEDQTCLPVGTTDLYLEEHHAANLLNIDGHTPTRDSGKWVLLITRPGNPAQPVRAWMVRLIEVTDVADPVFLKTGHSYKMG